MKKSLINKLICLILTPFLFIPFLLTTSGFHAATTRLPVLAYHQILDAKEFPGSTENVWVISTEDFARQMEYLRDNGYTTITTAQLVNYLYNKCDLPDKSVMITFDDGYLDNKVYAYPIMKEYGFNGVIFAITGAIAEEEGALKSYPAQFLSLTDMEETADAFEYGSHTHNLHRFAEKKPVLLSESKDNIMADLRESFACPLTFVNGFAYPYGRYNDNVIAALKEAGVKFAFTTRWGYVKKNSNPYTLGRFPVTGDLTFKEFTQIVGGKM